MVAELHNSDIQNIRHLSLRGNNAEIWQRLRQELFLTIEKLTKKISNKTLINEEIDNSTAEIAKDILKIASGWAKAIDQKPSLENEKNKAEISEKYSNAKKKLAEANKAEEEGKSIRAETAHKEFSYALKEVENVMTLIIFVDSVTIDSVQKNENIHLLVRKPNDPES